MFEDGKTLYQIKNEDGEITTITIEKWVADLLQDILPNVHDWIQSKYDLACEKFPQLSRRERGDLVRQRAGKEVENHPKMVEFLNGL